MGYVILPIITCIPFLVNIGSLFWIMVVYWNMILLVDYSQTRNQLSSPWPKMQALVLSWITVSFYLLIFITFVWYMHKNEGHNYIDIDS